MTQAGDWSKQAEKRVEENRFRSQPCLLLLYYHIWQELTKKRGREGLCAAPSFLKTFFFRVRDWRKKKTWGLSSAVRTELRPQRQVMELSCWLKSCVSSIYVMRAHPGGDNGDCVIGAISLDVASLQRTAQIRCNREDSPLNTRSQPPKRE